MAASTREVVRDHRDELAELTGDDGEAGKELVVASAWVRGSAEADLRGILGADTLFPMR